MQTNAAKTELTQTLVDRARAMLPALRERARQCEDECKVHDDTIREFQEAGFFKILQPKRWGGYELDPRYAAVEDWQPGVSGLTVELWSPVFCEDAPSAPCGADGYAADAATAVRRAKELIAAKRASA